VNTQTAPKPPPTSAETEAAHKRVLESFPYWARNFGKIADKRGRLIPFVLKPAQAELDRLLEDQRAAGKPMRAICLKARQVGISTAIQGKLIHRCTQRERYDAVVVAHDRDTGAKLYRMAETLYANLPEDPTLKPALGQHRRQRFLHFAGEGLWQRGDIFPDSHYHVDTAGEFQAGRGGTYRAIHASEVAFWDQINTKLASLTAAVPEDSETLLTLESTANGFNAFKDRWDDAEAGRSDYVAFFWPWWKEDEYSLPFASETEKERFQVGDSADPYADEEPDLVAHHGLSLEQLNWRRHYIANQYGGDVRIFHQEMPSTPAEAFISTGQKVFDSYRTAQLLVRVEKTDPRVRGEGGPKIGDLQIGETTTMPTRTGGEIVVPKEALWVPRERGVVNPKPPWKFWLSDEELAARPSSYVIGVDAAGGEMVTHDATDYHAIQVIDHKTRVQVAEYRSRVDIDLLATEVLLAALFFNRAWVAVERTGSYGQPILRIMWRDFHYPYLYRSKKVGTVAERVEQRLGWDTTMRTKPLLIAGMIALMRDEEDGIRSRVLAGEISTYTRTDKGTTEAESGRFDDCLMAYMVAQQIASELPPKTGAGGPSERAFRAGPASGLGSYDSRYG
jgi:hypothetical protein